MHTYRKCNYKFHLCTLLLVIFWLYFHAASCFSVNVYILNLKALAYKSSKYNCHKRFSPGKGYRSYCLFSLSIAVLFLSLLVTIWIALLLQQSGDIHPNPGPSSVSSDTSSTSVASLLSSIDLSKHLSFVHYNVQSVFPKLDKSSQDGATASWVFSVLLGR